MFKIIAASYQSINPNLADLYKTNPDLPQLDQEGSLLTSIRSLSLTPIPTDIPIRPDNILNFVWLGKPLTERADEINNLLEWRRQCPAVALVLWGDDTQCNSQEVKSFCEKNNILFINLKLFTDRMPSDLSKRLQLARDQFPPNYGFMSDLV